MRSRNHDLHKNGYLDSRHFNIALKSNTWIFVGILHQVLRDCDMFVHHQIQSKTCCSCSLAYLKYIFKETDASFSKSWSRAISQKRRACLHRQNIICFSMREIMTCDLKNGVEFRGSRKLASQPRIDCSLPTCGPHQVSNSWGIHSTTSVPLILHNLLKK